MPIDRERVSSLRFVAFAAVGMFLIFYVPLVTSLFWKENWLWMDEVLSMLLLGDPSIVHMNRAVLTAMDANPPLFFDAYWVLAHGISQNIYFLRAVSVGLFSGTVAWVYLQFGRLLPAPRFNFILFLGIFATTHLNMDLATQVRGYALYLAIAAVFFVSSMRLLVDPTRRWALVLNGVTGILLVAVHNFGLLYVGISGICFALVFAFSRRREFFWPCLAHFVPGALWLVVWLPSFLVQARTGDPHSWIPIPTGTSFFTTVGELIPTLSARVERVDFLVFLPAIRVLVLAALFAGIVWFRLRRVRHAVWSDAAFLAYIYSGVVFFAALFVAWLVSVAWTSVFLSRYFWPGVLLVAYQIVYAAHLFIRRRPRFPTWGLVACAVLGGFFVFHQNQKLVMFPKDIVPALRQLPPGVPVFVETADYFLPLSFHGAEPSVHYVLDWRIADSPGNSRGATVENRILANVREQYHVPGIVTLPEFTFKNFPHFFLVDESSQQQFEKYIARGRIKIVKGWPIDVPGHRLLECVIRQDSSP